MNARVVVITDRQLCADVPARLLEILRAVPRGSVAVQIREKDLDGGALLAFARPIADVCRRESAPLWVNDRLDVAMVLAADGVHLPERGLPIADARRGPAVGASRHSIDAALEAARDGADVVQLGPIWPSPGKSEALGALALRVRSRLPLAVKLVAVGGIDSVEHAKEAVLAGADAVALIRAAWSLAPTLVADMIDAIDYVKPPPPKSL